MYEFQSPSLRGSGRFFMGIISDNNALGVSIPFIAGQWSLQIRVSCELLGSWLVSIPFIAGQWSLPTRM